MKISERGKQAASAVLLLAAAAALVYSLFAATPPEKPSDLEGFVNNAAEFPSIGLLMDTRGTDTEVARIIFQCGADIAGGKLFGSHIVETYGCGDEGCISTSSALNGSSRVTYETARLKLRNIPYVSISAGKPSTRFFERHIDITLDESFNGTCKIG